MKIKNTDEKTYQFKFEVSGNFVGYLTLTLLAVIAGLLAWALYLVA